MGHPQFSTQDDVGIGHGIPPIPEWQLDTAALNGDLSELGITGIDHDVRTVFIRLRNVFQRAQRIPFPTTRLHDLTCYVVHRLLLTTANPADLQPPSPITECIRYATILYMFVVQGPTYYSHAVIFNNMLARLTEHLKQLETTPRLYGALDAWLVAIGMVASAGTEHYQWFNERGSVVAAALQLGSWDDVFTCIKRVLWLETQQGEGIFRPHWDAVLSQTRPSDIRDWTAVFESSNRSDVQIESGIVSNQLGN